jgi:catalase
MAGKQRKGVKADAGKVGAGKGGGSKGKPAGGKEAGPKTTRGEGGETHQQAGNGHPVLTTNQGVPVADNQNSLRAWQRGPTLLEDFIFREKMTHFDHERIPERVVHARGSAATVTSNSPIRWRT